VLTIKSAQLEALAEARERAFCNAIIKELKAVHAHRTLVWERPDLEQAALFTLRRATRIGLTAERDIRAFIALDLLIAPGWDSFPPLAKILAETRLTPEARMEHIVTRISPEEWDAVAAWRAQAEGE
jgi:hypothetical protein